MHGNAEYNGWQPLVNYGRLDSNGTPGVWEWAGHDERGGILWSGRLLGYAPPEQSPEEFVAQRNLQTKESEA